MCKQVKIEVNMKVTKSNNIPHQQTQHLTWKTPKMEEKTTGGLGPNCTRNVIRYNYNETESTPVITWKHERKYRVNKIESPSALLLFPALVTKMLYLVKYLLVPFLNILLVIKFFMPIPMPCDVTIPAL